MLRKIRSASLSLQFFLIMIVILSFTMVITFCASYEIAKRQVLDVGGEMFESVLKDSIGFIDAMNQRVEAGDLRLEEAQEIVRTYLLGPKNEGGERDISRSGMSTNDYMYTWAIRPDGTMVMHPFNYENQNLWGFTVNGKYIVRDSWANLNKADRVFRELWQNPGEPVYTFIAYQEYYAPWDWIVGTGGREEVIYKHRLVTMKWAFVHVAVYTFSLAFLLIYLFSRRFSRKINKINAAMSEVGKGNLQQNIHLKLKDEFGRLADNFNLMVHNLQDYVRAKSGEHTSTRDPVHDESLQYLQTLSESESRLIKLVTSRVLKAQEEERKRIARELHDGIGQVLYSVVIATKLLKKQIDVGGPHTDYVHDVEAAIAQTMTELKSIIHELRPAVLEEMGLVPAIQTYISKFESKYQIIVNLHIRTEHMRFSPEVETAVYRVLQEALVNAGKYAECDRIDIALLQSGSTLELTVRDFGTGFALSDDLLSSNGFGLYGMKERIHLLGGTIRIDSAPGWGTSIYVSIPLTP